MMLKIPKAESTNFRESRRRDETSGPKDSANRPSRGEVSRQKRDQTRQSVNEQDRSSRSRTDHSERNKLPAERQRRDLKNVRGHRLSSFDEVNPSLLKCNTVLNKASSPLNQFSDIDGFLTIYSSKPSELGKLLLIINDDAGDLHSSKAGALRTNAIQWYCREYRVDKPETINFRVSSKDYVALANAWENHRKATINQSGGEANSGRVIKRVEEMLVDAYKQKASDIHFEIRPEGAKVRYRVNGELRTQKHLSTAEADETAKVFWGKMVEGQGANFNPRKDGPSGAVERPIIVDGKTQTIRLRMQVLPHRSQAYDVQMRFMPTLDGDSDPDLLKLGYRKQNANDLELGIRNHSGLILFSGQTGSGKTTTLATLIQLYMRLNSDPEGDLLKKIITVEDPVEIIIPGCTQIQLEAKGDESLDKRIQRYAEPIRWSLRGDPDLVMVSEIREGAGANTVVSAVQSGHICLSTVHAQSNFGILDRLTSKGIGIARDVLSSRDFIRVLCNQALVQKLCPHCKIPIRHARAALEKRSVLGTLRMHEQMQEQLNRLDIDQTDISLRNTHGCSECHYTGITGVRVIAETTVPDDTIRKHIHSGDFNSAYMHWVNEHKGTTITDHALILIEQGLIDPFKITYNHGGLTPTNFRSGME